MPTKLIALTIALALTLAPLTATAQHTVQVRADGTRIRSGPGTSYAIVGYANKGDVFTVRETAKSGEWYRIGNGKWIASWLTNDYVKALPPGARE